MSALELYATQVRNQSGSAHLWSLRYLRSYIALCPDQELIIAINQMTDVELLRVLQEAGIRAPVFNVLISRINMLTKEQEEARK